MMKQNENDFSPGGAAASTLVRVLGRWCWGRKPAAEGHGGHDQGAFAEMAMPGLSTALQPTSARSPRIAPNFFRPVSTVPAGGTQGDDHCWSRRRLERSGARAEMRAVAEDGVADVAGECGPCTPSGSSGQFFELAGVAQHAVRTGDDMAADRGPGRISVPAPIQTGPMIVAVCGRRTVGWR